MDTKQSTVTFAKADKSLLPHQSPVQGLCCQEEMRFIEHLLSTWDSSHHVYMECIINSNCRLDTVITPILQIRETEAAINYVKPGHSWQSENLNSAV